MNEHNSKLKNRNDYTKTIVKGLRFRFRHGNYCLFERNLISKLDCEIISLVISIGVCCVRKGRRGRFASCSGLTAIRVKRDESLQHLVIL